MNKRYVDFINENYWKYRWFKSIFLSKRFDIFFVATIRCFVSIRILAIRTLNIRVSVEFNS